MLRHGFSFFHWSLIEQILIDEVDINDLDDNVFEQLIYNIFPGGNTILHLLASEKKKDALMKVYKKCHHKREIKHYLPFLNNYNNLSLFHILKAGGDWSTINEILKYLELYVNDHHSRAIKDLVPLMITNQLPNFLDYLDTRLYQTDQLKTITKGQLKDDYESAISTDLWVNTNQIKKEIMVSGHGPIYQAFTKSSQENQDSLVTMIKVLDDNEDQLKIRQIDRSIKLQLIDLPGIYHMEDKDFKNFFKALDESKQIKYFSNSAIQTIIDFNFLLVRKYMLIFILIPFTIFQVTFVVYMNAVYNYRQEQNYTLANYILGIIQLVFSAYFLFFEGAQIYDQKLFYFIEPWNYLDLCAPLGVLATQIIQFLEQNGYEINQNVQVTVVAWATLLMWSKQLNLLRIFRHTGYLIRMLSRIFNNTGVFCFVLFYTCIAFGDAFLRINDANDSSNQFIQYGDLASAFVWVWAVILGGFTISQFGAVTLPLMNTFFVMVTLFDMIVMLNLIISIISNIFGDVENNKEQTAYQEMASIIYENYFLVPKCVRTTYAEKYKYILTVTDMDQVADQADEDPTILKLQSIQESIDEQNQIMSQILTTASQLKTFGMMSSSNKKFQTKVHHHKLKKLAYFHMKELHPKLKKNEEDEGWQCNGSKYDGCKSSYNDKSKLQNKPNEIVFFCHKCSFIFCEQCYLTYTQEVHHHELVFIPFRDVQAKYPTFRNGWVCSGSEFTGCPSRNKVFKDEHSILYHDAKCNFSLCQQCVTLYKIKAIQVA